MTPEEQYTQILEKTNLQLSMSHNPYGIMVGILTIMIAVLSIAAVVIIFRQGRDYQSRLEKDRAEQKKKFDDFLDSQMKIIRERDKTAKQLNKKVDSIIDEYKKQLEESSASQRKEIQESIDKLELEKFSIAKFAEPLTVSPNSSTYGVRSPFESFCKCSSCGFGFLVNNLATVTPYLTGRTATCPKCGCVNSY